MSLLLVFVSLSIVVMTKAILSPGGDICGSLILLIRIKSSKVIGRVSVAGIGTAQDRINTKMKKVPSSFFMTPPLEPIWPFVFSVYLGTRDQDLTLSHTR
jgi:hypothetical protein